jgi:hypothetical protein
MNSEQSILLTIRHQMSTLGYSEDEINLQDESISHFTKLLVNNINLERKRKTQLTAPNSEKYKYFCENLNKRGLDQYTYAKDIDEAIAQDDVDGIIMIGKEFIKWLTDDKNMKGDYHIDKTTGEQYQDRDHAHVLSKVPKNELVCAIRKLESNRNDQNSKNIIQNILNELMSDMD